MKLYFRAVLIDDWMNAARLSELLTMLEKVAEFAPAPPIDSMVFAGGVAVRRAEVKLSMCWSS